jgi:hypothetical protein
MKYVWALVAVLYALLNIYVGYILFSAGIGAKLAQKGPYLQGPPILGGLALAIVALPLLWNCLRLVTAKRETY